MKNVPRKCPICSGKISSPDASGYVKCLDVDTCFFAHVSETGIDFYEAHFDLGLEEWEINSQKIDNNDLDVIRCCTELRDRDENLVLLLHEWYPYRTGHFLKDMMKLLDRMLSLKAFF